MKINIVYIKPNDSSFIRGDQQILEKHYAVTPVLLSQSKGNVRYAIENLKMFFKLLWHGIKKNSLFICWFADYHSAVMVLAAKITGAKSLIFIGGQEAVCYFELNKGVYRKKIRAAFVKYSLKNTDLIIANHTSLVYHKNDYYQPENPHIDGIKHYVKGLKTNVEIIYNGIDPQKFVRNHSIKKQESLVLTVGTMNQIGDFYNKGFDLFIEVSKRMPDLEFILIGLNKNYLQWTEDNYHFSQIPNLKIIPTYCPQEVLTESYNKAKVFVQASITEGMPNTLSEAMLLECIPVGSNINGIPDAIGDTGVIIKQRKVEELEKGIREALKMDTASKARERGIQLFSFAEREEKIQKSIESLMN